MGDIQNAEAAVKTEVVSVKTKVAAWLKAHIPHSLIGVGSYLGGKMGVIGLMIGKFY